MKTLKLICLMFFAFQLFVIVDANAQSVSFKMKRPPLNQLGIADLYNIEMTNNSRDRIEFYLFGTLSEAKTGLIATATTGSIILGPNEKKQFKISDMPQTPEISYPNTDGRYKEALMRKGSLPDGNYTICVTAKQTGTNEEIGNDCIEQEIVKESMSELMLLTPEINSQLNPDEPVTFTWSDPTGTGPYKIKIIEIKGDESPENAILKNKAFFEKEEIRSAMFQYPSSAPKFEKGTKYAWQIFSGSIKSPVGMFSTGGTHTTAQLDSVVCTGKPGEYKFWMKVCVPSTNSDFTTANITSIGFTNSSMPSTSTFTINTISPSLSQSITTPSSGSNCKSFTGVFTLSPAANATAVEMVATINYGSAVYQNAYPQTGVVNPKSCCVPISTLPPMVGWWPLDETSGTTFFDRAGFNNQGTRVGTSSFVTGMVAGASNFANGHITVNNHPDMNVYICDSLSIDAWIRTGATGTMAIVEKRELTSCGQPIGFSFFIQNGRLGFQLSNGASFGNYIAPTTAPLVNNNRWHLVAVTMSRNATNTIINLYVDGSVVHTVTNGMPGAFNNSSQLLIGCIQSGLPGGGNRFNGDIDEVEMFKRVLTQAQIQSIFNAGSAGKCKN